jgi:hypothetical protein
VARTAERNSSIPILRLGFSVAVSSVLDFHRQDKQHSALVETRQLFAF